MSQPSATDTEFRPRIAHAFETIPSVSPLPGARRALAGFFLSGILICFLSAILLSWEHHLSTQYGFVGLYYLALALGLLISRRWPSNLLERRGPRWTLAQGCLLAGLSFLYLGFVSPPMVAWWRLPGLMLLGFSIGVIHMAIFFAIAPLYRQDPAATVNLAGILFGLGCFAVAGGISYSYGLASAPQLQEWIAVVPAVFGWIYWRTPFPAEPVPHQPPMRIRGRMRSLGAKLLGLLILLQMGNEWVVAGWLGLFLSQRLGVSPASALWVLALYWLTLLVARVAVQWVLPRLSHPKLLLGAVLGSIFGCLVLTSTNNLFGAITGAIVLAITFAPVFPLMVERIGFRFPHLSPGFYRQGMALALAGGLLAPAAAGWVASVWGIGAVMLWPMIGSVIVALLVVLLSLDARLAANAAPR